MFLRLTWLLVALAGWLLPAAAQQEASTTLHARATPAGVEVVLQVAVSPTWYLYHTELGAPDAIGKPTAVDLSGIGVTFGELVWPAPHKTPQEWGANGRPTWTWTHDGTFEVFGFGTWDSGPPDDLDELPLIFATITGQTCSDVTGTCIAYDEELEVAGPGPDALFADFPAELRPAVATGGGSGEGESGEGDEAESATQAPGDQATPAKSFTPPPGLAGGLGGGQGGGFGSFGDPNRVDVTARHRFGDTGRLEVVLSVEVDPTWHLYHTELGPPDVYGLPAVLTLAAEGVTFGAPIWPEPHKTPQELGKNGTETWAWTHEGSFEVFVLGALDDPGAALPTELSGTLAGQVCSDVTGECLPVDVAFVSGLASNAAPFAGLADALATADAAAQPGDASEVDPQTGGTSNTQGGPEAAGSLEQDAAANNARAATGSLAPEKQRTLWEWILFGIGGGLFTLLMPCTYPMIPITVSFFTKQAEKTGKPPLALSLAYGLGIILMFQLIALVIGPVIIPFATHWVTNLIIGAVFFYFALVLLGVLNLNPPQALMNLAGTATQKGGFIGVFLMGATLVVTSFTCTAPIVGSLLSLASQDGSTLQVVVGMGAFGATMAIPFMVLSLVPGKMSTLPSAGEWMNTLKVTLGFVELAAAFKFFSNSDVALQLGLLPDEVLLLAWIVILGVAGCFLLGQIKLTTSGSDRITPVRSLFGMGAIALVGYMLMVLLGYPRGDIMTAFLPGYSKGSITLGGGAGGAEGVDHAAADPDGAVVGRAGQVLFVDDYEAARQRAIAEDKLLLVNLTGFT